MFSVITYARLKPCALQSYASNGMAMKILSIAVKVDSGNKPFNAGVALHTSTVREAKNLIKRFINKSTNRKKMWYETPPRSQWSQPSPGQTDFLTPPKKRPENSHRLRILNSLLFKTITDLLTFPELNSTILNYNVEVTRVSLAPDFSSCRVYWKSSGGGTAEHEVSMYSELTGGRVTRKTSEVSGPGLDSLIQTALDRSSAQIRYLITSRQTMGGVPPLVFIKDKQYATMVEVERLLQIADFGPHDLDERQDGREQLKMADSSDHAPSAKPVLFGVDHEALGRQIQNYKLHTKEAGSATEVPLPELTQTQLEVLEEYRRKKIIEKKKKKSKRFVDNDITPKEFLLAQQGWGREAEHDNDLDDHEEDAQLMELMAEEDKA